MKSQKPHIAIRFLRLFCHPVLLEDVEGDVHELYEEHLELVGAGRAGLLVWLEVLKLFRPGIIRPLGGAYRLNNYGMFKNHLTSAWRNLLKRKRFSALNIMGLSIGMAACFIIFQYVKFELSYDRFIPDVDNVYRVTLGIEGSKSLGSGIYAVNHKPVWSAIKSDFPEIEQTSRILKITSWGLTDQRISYIPNEGDKREISLENSYAGDQGFIDIFDLQFVDGDPHSALAGIFNIVLSETVTNRLFGDEYAIGKTVKFSHYTFKVAGIFKDLPANSHLQIDCIGSIHSTETPQSLNDWSDVNYYTYVKVRPGTDVRMLERKLDSFVDKYLGEAMHANGITEHMNLQPVSDIHLHSHLLREAESNGSYQTVLFLSAVGILILVIAWINFINLSTSRAFERASEVGIRKVIGASRGTLIIQFFVESTLINAVALGLSLIWVQLSASAFNELIGNPVVTGLSTYEFWVVENNLSIFACILTVGSFLAGLYPALVLSSYLPIKVLKGKFQASGQKFGLRNTLVIFQFGISYALITGTIVMVSQLRYMQRQQLGFKTNEMLVVKAPLVYDSLMRVRVERFENILLTHPNITNFVASSDIPGHTSETISSIKRKEDTESEAILSPYIFTDDSFIPTYQIELLEGRNFHKDAPADKQKVLINEMAAHMLGYASNAEAIGSKIQMKLEGHADYEILGVFRNVNLQSLSQQVQPLVLCPFNESGWWQFKPDYFTISLNGDDVYPAASSVRENFMEIFPDELYMEYFLDDHFNAQYERDKQVGKVFGIFSGLAILVACMGLLGLVYYVASTRTKEICIRKVLGASFGQILSLLGRQFITLVVVSFLVAIPVSWLLADNWLDNYAFRMQLHPWIFIVAGAVVLAIALLTVFWQSWKTAHANPVDSLRNE
ncbi:MULTISPECIES: ABC transporter permease [unclassified Imperialibacter]|uniref:ABC transporter permease n=1 Tax=unclassified Imperialibacter TaxID=2629706 RepID=UPI001258DCE4|nr:MULTISPECIES: ABC transporter permease [unclassified Imperialibacter]CAD5256687.1 putative ABC transporter permease [Imperialibacter sp. 89]CAD5271676.1 putative ABC transporter permease [Imperialibacter sp. 75]VVT19218.1 putative ABC transporter permease [Imperialibacter sp. EC-SDR9]